ncbi:hypothetical protein LCGC14_2479570, partial [marine sediment metagenome]
MSDYDAISKARSDAMGLRNEADITNLPPGYIEGFKATLDTDLHVTLTAGSTSVEGRQVTTNESHQIVDADFLGTRLGAYFYYIYLSSTGEFKVDRAVPEYSNQYLYYAHPAFNWRAMGKLWVDSADNDIKYVTNDVVGVSNIVTVAAFDDDEIVDADYKSVGDNKDDVFFNAALRFVATAYLGGEVHASRGLFNTTAVIDWVDDTSFRGAGKNATIFDKNADDVTFDANSVNNIRLSDLSIQRTASGDHSALMVRLFAVTNGVIEDIIVTGSAAFGGFGDAGIQAATCTNITINRCEVTAHPAVGGERANIKVTSAGPYFITNN